MSFCIYFTHHEIGKFYVGKAVTRNVLNGTYKGSGTILVDYFKKYPPAEWVTEILSEHATELEAYAEEARIVTQELVDDPMCLNINLGGKGGCRRKQSKEEIEKRAASIKIAKASAEHREMMSRVAAEALSSPAVLEKLSKASITMWQNPDMRNKINEARSISCGEAWRDRMAESTKKSFRKRFSVEVDGIEYISQRQACTILGLHRKQLRKLPSFKELICQ